MIQIRTNCSFYNFHFVSKNGQGATSKVKVLLEVFEDTGSVLSCATDSLHDRGGPGHLCLKVPSL